MTMFLSKHAALQYKIREPIYNYNVPPGMPPSEMRPALWAMFGEGGGNALMGEEFRDGEGNVHADIRGGVFDTDEAAARLGWTDEEKQIVEDVMLSLVQNPTFNEFRLYEKPVPVPPYPKYDQMNPGRIVAMAVETGMVAQVLEYERATEGREEIVKPLEKRVAEADAELALTAA